MRMNPALEVARKSRLGQNYHSILAQPLNPIYHILVIFLYTPIFSNITWIQLKFYSTSWWTNNYLTVTAYHEADHGIAIKIRKFSFKVINFTIPGCWTHLAGGFSEEKAYNAEKAFKEFQRQIVHDHVTFGDMHMPFEFSELCVWNIAGFLFEGM